MSHEITDGALDNLPPASERRRAVLLSSVRASILTGAVVGALAASLPAWSASIGSYCSSEALVLVRDAALLGAVAGIVITLMAMSRAWSRAVRLGATENLLQEEAKRGSVIGAGCSAILIVPLSWLIASFLFALCGVSV